MYLNKIEEALEPRRNPTNAKAMKKYMRDRYDYLGIKTPERREALREVIKANGYPKPEHMKQLSRDLWQKDEREYQYIAMDILKRKLKTLDSGYMELFEHMITTKSWWDTVDMVAATLTGGVIAKYPEQIKWIEKWRYSDDTWLRRSTLLFQLRYKDKADLNLLYDLINQNLGSKEFFINKAIGWALREYSKTDEQAIRDFVAKTELSNLSAREALKYVDR